MPEKPNPKSRLHPWARRGEENRREALSGSTKFSREPKTSASTGPSRRPRSYTELYVTTNFSFLTGASHPEEFVEQAAALGHSAIAVTDRNSLAGIVRAHVAAKEVGIPLVVGCRLDVALIPGEHTTDPYYLSVLAYPTDRASYARLCRLLTLGKRRAAKGECRLALHDLMDHHEGLIAVVVPPAVPDQVFIETVQGLGRVFDDDRLSLATTRSYGQDDRSRLIQLANLAEHVGVPLVATNDVHYHVPERRPLHDVVTCIRHGCTIQSAGFRLMPHAERYLKPAEEMARLFIEYPGAIARTAEISQRTSAFSLDELRYEYPREVCPPNRTPMQHLRDLVWLGSRERYPAGVPKKVRSQIMHEFKLIDELNYAPYFLTVHDLVVFARSRDILCQGRGAAANSAVCYCLGVTAVDPDRIDVLFERFVSKERDEPPDIDIDFEHERREEVIQYIYNKYGRDRAALTAEVITYRGRSAVREVGKAMGLSLDCVDRLAKNIDWWSRDVGNAEYLSDIGMNADDPLIRQVMALAREIKGFPRHLSQHVGGFVITEAALCELVPIENAAMPDRTVIEWDKDDIDAMGMLKVDVLGLGMLTCICKCLAMVNEWKEKRRTDCVAEENGTGEGDVSRVSSNAVVGTLRVDHPDTQGSRGHTFEYGGKFWKGKQVGPAENPLNRARFPQQTVDAARIGGACSGGYSRLDNNEISCGDRSSAVIPDQKPGAAGSEEDIGNRNVYLTSRSLSLTSPLLHTGSPSPPFPLALHTIPPEDPGVYDMICAADTIGVFQIESRAQMTMLPRLRPRCYYDLVIEVAIVRPGPIQGDMVHPYLRRRNGEEPVTYPDEKVRKILGKTLGVPLFQEQAMSLAIVAAGFTPGEADKLRRAMAAWKRKGDKFEKFRGKFINGMLDRGYEREFAERCFRQLRGFSEYGFPESHAASFSLLVYVSSWLKKYHPAAFAAALINSQPMGFYAPAQIVRDAQEHGVEVRPVDVSYSGWDCRLEEGDGRSELQIASGEYTGVEDDARSKRRHEATAFSRKTKASASACRSRLSSPALRLGMRLIKGMRWEDADTIADTVAHNGPFDSIESLKHASGVRISALRRLAAADAFNSMGLDRQRALWTLRAMRDDELPIFDSPGEAGFMKARQAKSTGAKLPRISEVKKVVHDYASMHLSLKAHPVSFLRDELQAMRVTEAVQLKDESRWQNGRRIIVAGLVLVRQRPATANGMVFVTLEDETGIANLILRPTIYKRFRKIARHGVVVLARGKVERQGEVVHVMVNRLEDLDERMASLASRSRDFH